MRTSLFDGIPVLMCSSSSLQKLEVAAESMTAVPFLSLLFLILRFHLRAILLLGVTAMFACSRPRSKLIALLFVWMYVTVFCVG